MKKIDAALNAIRKERALILSNHTETPKDPVTPRRPLKKKALNGRKVEMEVQPVAAPVTN